MKSEWQIKARFDKKGKIDLMWDHQQLGGNDSSELHAFLQWFNSKGFTMLKKAVVKDWLGPGEHRKLIIKDGGCKLTASPKGSEEFLFIKIERYE